MKNRQIIRQSRTNVRRYFYKGQEVSQSFARGYWADTNHLNNIAVVREDDWFWDMWKEESGKTSNP